MLRSTLIFSVLLVLGVTACTTDDAKLDAGDGSILRDNGEEGDLSAAADGPPPLPTAEDYCEQIVSFFCAFYLRCGRIAETNAEDCATTFLEICNEIYEPRYRALEAAGVLQLAQEGIAGCRAHLELVACEEQLMDMAGPCREMWQGLSPAGSDCGLDVEGFVCAPKSTCRLDLSFCGECVPAAETGERCGESAYCEFPDTCLAESCAPPALPGESCLERNCIPGADCRNDICEARTYVGVGASCDATHRCVYRSQCIGGTCVYAALLGEACAANTPCASGYCDVLTSGLCAPLKRPDETCTIDEECLSGHCTGNLCGSVISSCLGTPAP